jgi:hypothetical protein
VRADSARADAERIGSTRADAGRADSARAGGVRADSARADAERIGSTRADAGRAGSARPDAGRTGAACPDPTLSCCPATLLSYQTRQPSHARQLGRAGHPSAPRRDAGRAAATAGPAPSAAVRPHPARTRDLTGFAWAVRANHPPKRPEGMTRGHGSTAGGACRAKSESLADGDLYVAMGPAATQECCDGTHHDNAGGGGRPGRRIWPRSHSGFGPPAGKSLMIMRIWPLGMAQQVRNGPRVLRFHDLERLYCVLQYKASCSWK